MRITGILAMTLSAGMTVQAGQPKRQQQVTVYVQNDASVSEDLKYKSEDLASSMFASIGVKIIWRNGEPSAASSEQALAIALVVGAPKIATEGGQLIQCLGKASTSWFFGTGSNAEPYRCSCWLT